MDSWRAFRAQWTSEQEGKPPQKPAIAWAEGDWTTQHSQQSTSLNSNNEQTGIPSLTWAEGNWATPSAQPESSMPAEPTIPALMPKADNEFPTTPQPTSVSSTVKEPLNEVQTHPQALFRIRAVEVDYEPEAAESSLNSHARE